MSARYFEACEHAKLYSQFRPSTPPYLIKKILEYLNKTFSGSLDLAVDVACGSGQSSRCLAQHFKNVTGVDISEAQINEATATNTLPNLKFKVCPAEKLSFANSSVQLITTGTACHWFGDMAAFFKECDRILSPGGVLVIYTYQLPNLIWGEKLDQRSQLLNDMLINIQKNVGIGPMHDVQNRYTNEKYIIPYSDFHRIEDIKLEKTVTVIELLGYVKSTAGYQLYMKEKGEEAAAMLLKTLQTKVMETLQVSTTPEKTKLVMSFPYVCLIGSKPK